ncbi:MAG TPA: hypothetical protein VGK00_07030 [Anaerolineales bacterium]|jgi:hypothetical protein
MNSFNRSLWFRWIAVNAISEMIGLGATFAVLGLVASRFENAQTYGGVLLSFVIAVASGSIEATIVGLSQWWAMHPWFPFVERFAWWRATLVGALLGYVLGYLPSTLLNIGESAGQPVMAEPAQWLTLLLAAGLGAVAGAVLSFAQWLVLRDSLHRAGIWIPANMLAWVFGMPVIFQTMDIAFRMPTFWLSMVVVAAGLFIAGAVVGAIHGLALVHFARQTEP